MKKYLIIGLLIVFTLGLVGYAKADVSIKEMLLNKLLDRFDERIDKVVDEIMTDLLDEEVADESMGAIGSKLIESYVPVVRYNEGLYSELPFYTTSTFRADRATTFSLNLATTTAMIATSTTFSRTDPSGAKPLDGFGNILVFALEDEGSNTAAAGTGLATTTFEIWNVLDDTATTSIEHSLEFRQKLDNDYLTTKILDIDSGMWQFIQDIATTSELIAEMARWTRYDDTGNTPIDGIGSKLSFWNEFATTTAGRMATTTHEFYFVVDDTDAATSVSTEYSFQIWQKADDTTTGLTNVLEIDSGDLIIDTDTLFVDISTDSVGIGTTTPAANLSVEQLSSGIPFLVGDQGTTTAHLIVDRRGQTGIGTSSPAAGTDLAIGGSGAVGTTTIDFSKACFKMDINDNGVMKTLYYWPCLGSGCSTAGIGSTSGWATSTDSCNN